VRVGFRENTAVLRPNEFPLQIVKRRRQPFDDDGWLFEIKHNVFG